MCDIGQRKKHASGLSENLLVSDELPADKWPAIIDRLGVDCVHVIGVEPLLHQEFDKLVRAISPNRSIVVTTNGWFIDKWFEALKDYCHEVIVSIDGLQSTHDAVRGMPGSFERAIKGLTRLREAGKKVMVSSAVSPDSLQDMLPLHAFLHERGIPMIINHYNYIHAASCVGYPCTPANVDVYDPASMSLDLLYRIARTLPHVTFYPDLRTRRELQLYYQQPPTRRLKTREGCSVLEETHAGTRFILASNGNFIPGNRCWIKKPLGNALAGDLPAQSPWLAATIADIRSNGLYPPCQRLCCAGKALYHSPLSRVAALPRRFWRLLMRSLK
jgi:hypothetical protein